MNKCKCSFCGEKHDCPDGCYFHPQYKEFCSCTNCMWKLDFKDRITLQELIKKIYDIKGLTSGQHEKLMKILKTPKEKKT